VRGARLLFKQVNLNGGHARLPCEIEDGKFACPCPINGFTFAEDMTATHTRKTGVSAMPAPAPWAGLDVQLVQLRAAGCNKNYPEKVTGARAARRELLRVLDPSPRRCGEGDAD
jgi:hypothetical protein